MSDQSVRIQEYELSQFQASLLPRTENKIYQSCFTDVPSDSNQKLQYMEQSKVSSSRFFYNHYPSVQDRRLLVPLLDTDGLQNVQLDLKIIIQNYQMISQGNRIDILNLQYDGSQKLQYQALSHYISVWLLAMGYMVQKNKKYILGRMLMHLGKEGVKKGNKLYKNLLKSELLSRSQRLKYLIQVCKNGWEQFISITIKIIQQQVKKQLEDKKC